MPPVAKRKTAAAATAGKLVLAPIFRSSKNKNQSVRGGGKEQTTLSLCFFFSTWQASRA